MSVYTSVEKVELEAFLSDYEVDGLLSYEGISAGIENTNYFVDTVEARWVLTIFEHHCTMELGYFLELMEFLAQHQIPTALPKRNRHGGLLGEIKTKPAALVQRLSGGSVEVATLAQCRAVGQALGRLHLVGQKFSLTRKNERDLDWCVDTALKLESSLLPERWQLIQAELDYQQQLDISLLPKGVVHCDLFRDNVLFEADQVSGLIDFYYACTDVLLYDVAVTVNDWCSAENGLLVPSLAKTFLDAYESERELSVEERRSWWPMLRLAAMRFWLSRLYDRAYPRDGELTHFKNPEFFGAVLNCRQQEK